MDVINGGFWDAPHEGGILILILIDGAGTIRACFMEGGIKLPIRGVRTPAVVVPSSWYQRGVGLWFGGGVGGVNDDDAWSHSRLTHVLLGGVGAGTAIETM